MRKINKKLNLGTIISLIVGAILLIVIAVFMIISFSEVSQTVLSLTDEKLGTAINGVTNATYNKVDAANKELLRYVDLIKLLESPVDDVMNKKEETEKFVDQFNSRFKDVTKKTITEFERMNRGQVEAFENVSMNAEQLTGMSEQVKKAIEGFKVNQ
ncbi:MAG: hypothetical protein SPJ62_05810 [Inconstantimicrobium porci]|uniref:hypothetical protein n=1 Tax=Inconstantimicrobium porci TaxID=2652291 RepID=UPI002A918CC2|nr:hypothetical protein [Inconstantimicrobium porci]MDY5911518.1 hypothetical protein [Inconstantimicrobium porci]